ncbi:helix-turn-helix domain-containing protein, partial [Chelativorans sp.]|uniref:ArsR/SmtB family transcription factor n=1 Tax=Chelativorans sp. TaxID=2203393 RepID=UPI00281168D9
MNRNFLLVDPEENMATLRGLASPVRARMLKLLHVKGSMNVNDIARELSLPQSTVSSNLQILEEGGLIRYETVKARKGNQKICHSTFDEILVVFKDTLPPKADNTIEVAMPLGLYTACK